MTFGPIPEIGIGIDMSFGAYRYKTATPMGCKILGSFRRNIIIVGAGYDYRRKGEGIKRHRSEARRTGRIGRRFGIAGRHEEGAFDGATVVLGPENGGTTGQAVTDEDHVFGREGRDDLVDGVDPVFGFGVIPVPLMDTGIAVAFFPARLPMPGTGIVETRKDKAEVW